MAVNPSAMKSIIYEKRDRKAYITLNRPEAMNAINAALREEYRAAVDDYQHDDELLCAIVTGAGGRAFSAGADLKEMSNRGGPGRTNVATVARLSDYGNFKPLIAAIDGYCLAGGLELAIDCDIRIATAGSTFGLPEPRRGLLAGPGLHYLSRMIPLGNALYIQLTGRHVDAEFVLRSGFIQEIVPDRETLMRRADELAGEILKCAPLAVAAIKRIVMLGRNLPVEYGIHLAAPIEAAVYASEDTREGPRAFAEKRDPVWKNR